MITGKSYIGHQLSGTGTKIYTTFNPQKNKENPWHFIEATTAEINQAVSLATYAFQEYKNYSGTQRAGFLNTIAKEIKALGTQLIETYCAESGLPPKRAQVEIERTLWQLQMFANTVTEGSWVNATIETGVLNRQPISKPDVRKMLVPIGPVAVFGASNFPLAYSTAGGDTASALASGCPVIVKSHPMHAGTGEMVASAIIQAAKKTNMPDGVFSNINSGGIESGKQLVLHPQIKGVGFTGSFKGGKALYNLAMQREEPIPVFAEMGSINPVVIFPQALKNQTKKWAQKYAHSITLGSGQFCTSPGLILSIEGESLTQFIEELSKEIMAIAPSCMLHPDIVNSFQDKCNQVLQQDNIITTAKVTDKIQPNYARQTIVTVKGETFFKNRTLHQEVFGPFSIVVQCKDAEELKNIILALEGQLTGTIIAEEEEVKYYQTIVEALQSKVGRFIFNGVSTGVEVCSAMHHGGPYPATTDARFTAVGIDSIIRWVRPICYQNWPDSLLPQALQNNNPLNINRKINGKNKYIIKK